MKLRIPLDLVVIALMALVVLLLPQIAGGPQARTLVFLALMLSFGLLSLILPRVAMVALIAMLLLIGDTRRYVNFYAGYGGGNDPLLLVGPICTLLMIVVLLARNRVHMDTPLSKLVMGLSGWMAVEILNPLQGGLSVGLGGAFFYLVPLSWYWIGKAFADPVMVVRICTQLVIPAAVIGAIYGIHQSLYGLAPYQQAWVTANHLTWLYEGGSVRAISFFTSPIEYARFVTIAIALIMADTFIGRPFGIVFVPLLLVALFLESSRGPIVIILFTLSALWAAQGRSRATWGPRLLLALAMGIAALGFVLTHANDAAQGTKTAFLVKHQTQGLLDPGGSTAGAHSGQLKSGLLSGLRNPIGNGLGSTTMAAGKFGSSGGSSEIDFSDQFLACGLPGGILYLLIMYRIITQLLRLWVVTRLRWALLLIAILTCSIGSWLIAGDYAKGPFVWLGIGAMDEFMRRNNLLRPRTQTSAASAQGPALRLNA